MAQQPENAYLQLLATARHDVVVANSLPRLAMSWIADDLRSLGVPLVIYLREQHALTHLTVSRLVPDAVVANSLELCARATAAGTRAEFIPSIVDLSAVTVSSSRKTAVLINPVRAHRPELVVRMAAELPDIPFVLQESWSLRPEEVREISQATARLANLTLRRRMEDSSEIYRDARVVIAPYPAGRPRVVAEAHHNGIPVIGLDQPSMAEAIGPGGVVIPDDAPGECWVSAVRRIWEDPGWYGSLVDASRQWARRAEVQPETVLRAFEAVLTRVVGATDG
jgi:glycosyltransferase involved in cell wall biosynthesis